MTRVLLVDDHTIVREGLKALLQGRAGIEVVGEAASGKAAIAQAAALQPDVVVMDVTLPDLGGIEATAAIVQARPETRVLMLSMHDSEDVVRPAIRAGASGYLLKGSGLTDLVAAIEAVAAGQAFFSPAVSRVLLTDPGRRAGLGMLTPREQQVLQFVAQGHTSQATADALGISSKTVEAHRANLMAKLDLHDLPALVKFAVRTGLVPLE